MSIAACCGRKMYSMKKSGNAYAYCCSMRTSMATHPSEACPGGGHNMRAHAVDAIGWEGTMTRLLYEDNFAALLRSKYQHESQGHAEAWLASSVEVLGQTRERRRNLAKSLGLPMDDETRNDIITEMDAVSMEIQRLEAQALEAQASLDNEQVHEETIKAKLDRTQRWRETWLGRSTRSARGL